ncbi:hypothetical protein BpHYR1_024822 [Brachionus plicatilis]|uniref:Uncharacterized protein n=1 Tax=Brachionus plicatilis TaxID=10195 RepID=A0A3M7PNR1_BRAPC|nr:hypothetical protein BpHYR1_024822 [Brachionus plicatilis]
MNVDHLSIGGGKYNPGLTLIEMDVFVARDGDEAGVFVPCQFGPGWRVGKIVAFWVQIGQSLAIGQV